MFTLHLLKTERQREKDMALASWLQYSTATQPGLFDTRSPCRIINIPALMLEYNYASALTPEVFGS